MSGVIVAVNHGLAIFDHLGAVAAKVVFVARVVAGSAASGLAGLTDETIETVVGVEEGAGGDRTRCEALHLVLGGDAAVGSVRHGEAAEDVGALLVHQTGETSERIVAVAGREAAGAAQGGLAAEGVVGPLHLAGDGARIKGRLIGENESLGGPAQAVVDHLGDAALEVLAGLEVAEAVVGLAFAAVAREAAAELSPEVVVAEGSLAALGVGETNQEANRGDKFRGLRNESR